MTDLDPDEQRLVAVLHDRLDRVQPDLAGLAAGATLQGTRIRRRRRAGAGLAGAACAGLVLGGVFLLPGLGVDRSAPEPGFLSGPASTPSQEPAAPRDDEPVCPDGGDLRRTGPDPAESGFKVEHGRMPPNPAADDGATPVRPVAPCADTPENRPLAEGPAFSIAVPEGWSCDEPGDQKVGCASASGGLLTVIQRPAEGHATWVRDPDKGAPGTGVLVSDPHGAWFVTVDPTSTDVEETQQIAGALTWDDGTPVF